MRGKCSIDVDGRRAERATKIARGYIRKTVVPLLSTCLTRGGLREQKSLHILKGMYSVGELFFYSVSAGIFPMQIYMLSHSDLSKFRAVQQLTLFCILDSELWSVRPINTRLLLIRMNPRTMDLSSEHGRGQ